MSENYKKAYTEVLEIIKYLPKEEYKKIPEEKIQFFRENCDKNYNFNFDISKTLEEQEFLRETNAIIVTLFRDFFATEQQKEKLQKILLDNEEKHQEELRKKYNPDNLFKKQENEVKGENVLKEESTALVEVKDENIIQKLFKKVIDWIKSFI